MEAGKATGVDSVTKQQYGRDLKNNLQDLSEPLSDKDIAVYLAESCSFSEIKLDILGSLVEILQTDEIDLVVLNTAELPLRMNILKTKKVIKVNLCMSACPTCPIKSLLPLFHRGWLILKRNKYY
jgi:hypothetical protein